MSCCNNSKKIKCKECPAKVCAICWETQGWKYETEVGVVLIKETPNSNTGIWCPECQDDCM
jgi:hypothetical protein